jgi:tetratricopeptide (TPR) repeat protein
MLAMVVVVGGAAIAGCAGPPWLMGHPLNGQPSIPTTTLSYTAAEQHRRAAEARAAGLTVEEFEPLQALETAERLDAFDRVHLVQLLLQRADDFATMARAIPRSRDIEHALRLDPSLAPVLRPMRALAVRDAGDAWLSIGDRQRAAAAFQQADDLAAFDLSFRLIAAGDESPPPATSLAELQRVIAILPLRSLRAFGDLYLRKAGDDRSTLLRLLAAARQDGDLARAARLREALAKVPATDGAPPDATPTPVETPPAPLPADLEIWVLRGPTLERRLLPLLAAQPALQQPPERARRWSQLLLAEDPTSPAVLETAALIDGLARRFGGTERKLIDLVYYSPDRADGFVRAAGVWERAGRPRDACAQRVRAARWRDDPEDPLWRAAIACTRNDPGAGDWRAIRQYVLDRAPADRREALAATLDGGDSDKAGPVATPAP